MTPFLLLSFILHSLYYINSQLLPLTISPLFCHLILYPDFNTSRFDGLLDISLNITLDHVSDQNNNFSFTLNTIEEYITIWDVTINCNTPTIENMSSTNTTYNKSFDELTIIFNTLPNSIIYTFIKEENENATWNNDCMIYISYTGIIQTNNNKGIYLINNKIGKRKYLLTKFKPNYARYAIPSWDEPYFVSSFELEIIIPILTTAISNAPIDNNTSYYTNEYNDHCMEIIFNSTQFIPIYMLSFIIGEFEQITSNIKYNNVKQIFYSDKNEIMYTKYALNDASVQFLNYLSGVSVGVFKQYKTVSPIGYTNGYTNLYLNQQYHQ